MSLFDHISDCRVFNDPSQDALSIVTAVLAKRGLTDTESGPSWGDVIVAQQLGDLNMPPRWIEQGVRE